MLETPVAFIIFNRPDLTERVFQAIRQAQPRKLLVIADGPRLDRVGEAEKCTAARAVIDQVDWDCEVLKNYSDINLGCRQRVSSGLDWVFSEVEEAIILEDDCLPSPSFFYFCQTLLEHYRCDERVMHISGNNFQPISRTIYSYYFSKYPHIWGWASWRRAWKHYDVEMKTWQAYKNEGLIHAICEDPYEQKYWLDIFDCVSRGEIDTWDYQWTYAFWSQGGLSVIPQHNLVSNLGFRNDATHTHGISSLANMRTYDMQNMQHPKFVVRHQEADQYTFDTVFGGNQMKKADTLSEKILSRLSKIKHRVG
jgi:hypothetical protein